MLKAFKYIKNQIILIICIALLFSSLAFVPHKKLKGITTVVIDAGHGGKDPGCNGVSHNEKEVTLAIALKLGKLIEENLKDVKVIYTRKTDVFVELEERAKIANDNTADLFISIHCNAAAKFVTYKDKKGTIHYKTYKDKKGNIRKKEVPNPTRYGSETYVMGIKNEKGKMEVAKRENASMLLEDNYQKTYGGFDPNSDEAYIIMTLTTSAYVNQSAKFAAKIQQEYAGKAGRIDKGVQRESFWVLWRTAMPSILTEVGFLTNPIEEKFLGSEKGQNYIASAIFRALRNYKNEVEGQNVKYDDEIENEKPIENENLIYEKEHPELKLKIKNDSIDSALIVLETIEDESTKKNTEQYNKLIKQADEKFKERKLDEAKNLYTQAIEIKKGDEYSNNKLNEISKLEIEIKKSEEEKSKANEALTKQYNSLINEADTLVAKKMWQDAKKKYQEALITKPGEKYPKQKIKEIEDIQITLSKQLVDSNSITPTTLINSYSKQPEKDSIEKKTTEVKKDTIKKDTINKKTIDNPKQKNNIVFKVQFMTSDKEIDMKLAKFRGLENVEYYKAAGLFKYTSGNFTNTTDAINHQNNLRKLGHKEAFVVAFKNAKRIDYKEALKLMK